MKRLKHTIDAYVDEAGSKYKTNIVNRLLMKPTIYPAHLINFGINFLPLATPRGD